MRYDKSKKLIQSIIKEENIKNNIDVEAIALTSKLDLIYQILTKKIPVKLYENLNRYSKYLGLFNHNIDNTIELHLDKIRLLYKDNITYLYAIVHTSYHEYNHALFWNNLASTQYEQFITILETLIRLTSQIYNHHPDDFYTEIIADIYGCNKAEKYFKNYPNIYNQLSNEIERYKLYYQIDYINYDAEKFFNYTTKIIKNSTDIADYLLKNNFIYIYLNDNWSYKLSPNDPLNNLIKILYNKDLTFKTPNELALSEEWNLYNKEIKYLIVSSKSYLEDIDLSNLALDELNFLLEALEYSYEQELKRLKENENLRVKIEAYKQKNDKYQCLEKNYNKVTKRNYYKIKYLQQQITIINDLISNKIVNKKIITKK